MWLSWARGEEGKHIESVPESEGVPYVRLPHVFHVRRLYCDLSFTFVA
jgi:hypothetical protein